MSKTVDQIRRENGIRWSDIYRHFGDMRGKKRDLQRAVKARCHWSVEAALCEAMRRVANLQTDIEDFAPAEQPPGSAGGGLRSLR